MDKKTIDKVNNISSQIESGYHELGKENNVSVEVTTIYKLRKKTLEPNVMMFQHFADKFSQLKNISAATYRVFFKLVALTQYENFVSVDIDTLADLLEIHKRTVIRAIKELEELNIVIKTPHVNDKRRHEYFINPYTLWKGNSESRHKKITKLKDKNKSVLELPFSS